MQGLCEHVSARSAAEKQAFIAHSHGREKGLRLAQRRWRAWLLGASPVDRGRTALLTYLWTRWLQMCSARRLMPTVDVVRVMLSQSCQRWRVHHLARPAIGARETSAGVPIWGLWPAGQMALRPSPDVHHGWSGQPARFGGLCLIQPSRVSIQPLPVSCQSHAPPARARYASSYHQGVFVSGAQIKASRCGYIPFDQRSTDLKISVFGLVSAL